MGFRTEKILVYSAAFRVDGGHHEIWCSPIHGPGSSELRELRTKMAAEISLGPQNSSFADVQRVNKDLFNEVCDKHIKGRGKDSIRNHLLAALPARYPARYCKTTVQLDHFKFVAGIEEYLNTRWRIYKAKGLHWWKDSYKIVKHIERHNHTVCVDCHQSRCFDTEAKLIIPPDRHKVFYCGRQHQPCVFFRNSSSVE